MAANTGSVTSKTFTPIKTPVVSGIWPSQGQKAGGTLTITGSHLTGATAVQFTGAAKTAKPAVLSDHTILVKVPLDAQSGTLHGHEPGRDVEHGHVHAPARADVHQLRRQRWP